MNINTLTNELVSVSPVEMATAARKTGCQNFYQRLLLPFAVYYNVISISIIVSIGIINNFKNSSQLLLMPVRDQTIWNTFQLMHTSEVCLLSRVRASVCVSVCLCAGVGVSISVFINMMATL